MTYGVIATLFLALLSAPFVGGIALIAYLVVNKKKDRKRKSRHIAMLRARIRSLPLDEEALEKRLETFDRVLAEVKNEKIKMEYLKQLAVGEKVKVGKKEKGNEEYDNNPIWHEIAEKSRKNFFLDLETGVLPSNIYFHGK